MTVMVVSCTEADGCCGVVQQSQLDWTAAHEQWASGSGVTSLGSDLTLTDVRSVSQCVHLYSAQSLRTPNAPRMH